MTIENAIKEYKDIFQADGGLANELYKWKLITEQYQRPTPQAYNLAEEIHAINYYNLVYGPQYYDVITYAEEAQEIISDALKLLFDENKPLQDRVSGFKIAIDSCWEIIKDKYPERKKKSCDERLTSFFLTLHDPGKYTFYKNDLYLYLCRLTGEQKKGAGKKLTHYYDMLNTHVLPKVKEDKELLNAINAELDKLGYRKSDLLVAQTVLWMIMPRTETAEPKTEPRYWIYAPGENANYWQTCQEKGIMAIGWQALGDLNQFSTLEELKESASEVFENDINWTQSGLALWQYVHDMKIGDIIIAKKGRSKIVGRGIVKGNYEYRPENGRYPNVRKVEWTDSGNWPWENERLLPLKTLTRISDDGSEDGHIKQLLGLFDIAESPNELKETKAIPTYTKEDFLREVFMSESEYDRLLSLLAKKKNIILQGAPGVGKTFTAKRLAFSIIGREDTSKVEIIQFHQNYSYEDFIMGYKPTEDGSFTLRNGIFYSFCKRAALDKANKYFFIIDEINRGNLSKIFGELLMLIETGYRGKDIRLAYNGEEFSVPGNVHIIGMMNTADRSLAMIDYALRRRFSFFDIKPGFDSEGFKKMQNIIGNEKFDKVVDAIKSLNKSIEDDASLGAGFCIGHSYFCLSDDEEYSDMWLQNIVDYDIEPMLREYWFDNPEKSVAEISKIKLLLK